MNFTLTIVAGLLIVLTSHQCHVYFRPQRNPFQIFRDAYGATTFVLGLKG